MMLKKIRHYLRKIIIERHYPFAVSYRTFRDYSKFKNIHQSETSYGFKFAGIIHEDGQLGIEQTKVMIQKITSCEVFIDIGANIGFYCCLARSMGKHVIAIEPLNENLRYLFRNFELNGWKDIEVWPVGLSAQPELATIFGDGAFASLIKGWAGNFDAWKQTIALNTLDNILGERFLGLNILIKIDVEGVEYGVLKGSQSVIKRVPKPVWFIEIHLDRQHPNKNYNFKNTFEIFRKNGYEAFTADTDQRLVTETDVKRWVKNGFIDLDKYNFCFISKDT